MNNNKTSMPNLALCILLDLVGMASFTIPGIGEFSDVIWAPISGFIFYRLFGGKIGMYGGAFSVIEEMMPGLDFIPTFTISWFLRKRELAKQNPTPGVIIINK